MSASADILREFLVLIGFQADEKTLRKSINTVEDVGKKLLALGAAAEAASLVVVASLGKMAQGFEDAFYAAEQTESSVAGMRRFAYIAGQIGSSSDEARSAVKGLSDKMRENIGTADWLKTLGVKDVNDRTKAVQELLGILAKMPENQAKADAALAAIPENLRIQWRLRFGEIDKFGQDSDKKQQAFGFNLEKAAADGRDLERSFRDLGETLAILKYKVASDLFQKLQPGLNNLSKFVEDNADKLSKVLTDIASALLKMFTYVVENLPKFEEFVEKMGGWEPILTAIAFLLANSVLGIVPNMALLLTSMLAITGLVMPAWLLGLLGVAGLNIYENYNRQAQTDPGMADGMFQPEGYMGGVTGPGGAPAPSGGNDDRAWYQKILPKFLGGKDAPAAPGPQSSGTPGEGYGKGDTPELAKAHLFGRNPDLEHVDPRLRTILSAAQMHLPPGYKVEVTEGFNPSGHAPNSQHHVMGRGAIDLQIVGPDGKVISNRGGDPTGVYHQLARAAYGEMLARYPDLKGRFAWGGQFGTVRGGSVSDLMHYDLGGERGHLTENAPSRMGSLKIEGGKPVVPWLEHFDPYSVGKSFQTPLGDFNRSGGNSITHAPSTMINVTGTPNPDATPGQIGSPAKRDHTQLMQNLQSAVG